MDTKIKGKSDRPNIILIITDQQRFDTINALGASHYQTPNLDRLVNEGVSFTNCFIPAASCIPCRASLFSGCYPHNNGVWSNADTWDKTWVTELANSGYQCVNIGKMHTKPFESDSGFHQRYVTENKDRYLEGRYYFDDWDRALAARGLVKQQRILYRKREDYNQALGAFLWEIDADMHPDMFVENRVHWWLKNYPKTEPLFMEIGFPGPHPPYDPLPEYAAKYDGVEFDLQVPTTTELKEQPEPWRTLRVHNSQVDHDSIVHDLNPSMEARQRQRQYYAANVTMIDDAVGRIMHTLEETGYLENSIIIFTSDHGDALGDHGHSQKWTMYDIIMRVPCIVWAPERFKSQRVDALCQWHDLGPTILDLAGVTVPSYMDAKSLLPALVSPKDFIGREFVFAEEGSEDVLNGSAVMLMIRNKKHKLVYFQGCEDGALFDLEADPNEEHNLWWKETETRRALEGKLLSWLVKSLNEGRNYPGIHSYLH